MIALDKQLHILAGAAIAGVGVAYGLSPVTAFGLAVFAGVAKEAWDATGRGTVEALDAIATIAGGAVVLPLAVMGA